MKEKSPIAIEKEPLQDHCGIVAAHYEHDFPFFITGLAGLIKLQTRGYEGAGLFALLENGEATEYRAAGLINEVFTSDVVEQLKDLRAKTWLLQTRYGTDGDSRMENLQPIVRLTSDHQIFAVVHNGQFSSLETNGLSDTVRFAETLAHIEGADWNERILNAERELSGAWSMAVATTEGLFLLRDRFGIRPLSLGAKVDPVNGKMLWLAASETTALQAMGVGNFIEVAAGSVIKITNSGIKFLKADIAEPKDQTPCVFENIYLASGKSVIHRARKRANLEAEMSVEEFRRQTGKLLAERETNTFAQQVDFACGVPGTGIAGGRAYAETLGIPYIQAITDRQPMENDARTFMTPNIEQIPDKISKHFYFEKNYFRGMRLVLIDDSIVRGNITKGLIKLLKVVGAKEVHIRALCLPIDKPCHLGISTHKRSELIAARGPEIDSETTSKDRKHQVEQLIEGIRQEIGADSLKFLADEDLFAAAGDDRNFCLGCMVGHKPPIDKFGKLT